MTIKKIIGPRPPVSEAKSVENCYPGKCYRLVHSTLNLPLGTLVVLPHAYDVGEEWVAVTALMEKPVYVRLPYGTPLEPVTLEITWSPA